MATRKKAAAPAASKDVAATSAKRSMMDLYKSVEAKIGARHIELRPRTAAEILPFGCLSLSLINGGGFYSGRTLQYFGYPGSGKSTLAFMTAARLIQRKIFTIFNDCEGKTELKYIKSLGVDPENSPDNFVYTKPQHGVEVYQQWMGILEQLDDMDSGPPQVCFMVDSIATMPTPGEMKNWEESRRLAERAAMHSEWWGRLKTLISRKNATVLAVNQLRANPSPYAAPEARPGGNAWEFNTDALIRVARGKQIEVQGHVFQTLKFKTLKNSWAEAPREIEVKLWIGHGIDPAVDVVTFLKKVRMFKKMKKGAAIEGLGSVDRTFASLNEVENTLRNDGYSGKIYQACQELLDSGEAYRLYDEYYKEDPNKKPIDAEDPHAPKEAEEEAGFIPPPVVAKKTKKTSSKSA